MTASAEGLQQKLSSLSNDTVAGQICTCLQELKSSNPDLCNRLTTSLYQLAAAIPGRNAIAKTEFVQPVLDPATVLTTLPAMSCATPRGKFDVIFTTTGLALRNNKNLIKVPYASIECVYILDRMKEERAKKVYMLLQFEDSFSAPHGKKTIRNITIETKDSLELDAKFPETPSNGERQRQIKGPAAVVLCQLLGQMKVTNFKAPEDTVFSGRGKVPCIAALHKFNKGWLFPLKGVLIFIGTQCFAMPHKSILGVDMPGVGGDRRTFDLVFHSHSGEKLAELMQIDSGDLAAWGEYMRKEGLKQVAGTRGEGTGDAGASGADGDEDDDDEDADDEDFEVDESDGEERDHHHAGDADGAGAGGGFGLRRPGAGSSGAGTSSGPPAAASRSPRGPPAGPPSRKRLRSAAAGGSDEVVLELPEGGLEEELLSEGGTEEDSDGEGSDVSSGDDA
eukprot:jgi/Ulvmu1/874/UM100_0027.1